MTDRERRLDFQKGLRDLADFLAAHPEVPTPPSIAINAFPGSREALTECAKFAGAWTKHWTEGWFFLRKNFGESIQLELNIERTTVCHKIIKGTKIVPAQPEHEVEEYEWVCDDVSLLAVK